MITFNPWPRDYQFFKEDYNRIFEQSMMQSNDGVEDFEEDIAHEVGRKYAIAVNSATDALHFSLEAYGIGQNDEVLVSNFSWISSASCVKMVGANPVFCDIDLDTYCISLDSMKRMKTDKTKAVIYTPLYGSMKDTTELEEWCTQENLILIEDSAQAWGSSYQNKKAGTVGDISSFSFNTNKVVCSPVGGGIVLTDNFEVAQNVAKLRRHGNGEFLGRNSKLYPFAANIIRFRISNEKNFVLIRQKIAEHYNNSFSDIGLNTQWMEDKENHNYHKYTLRFEDIETRAHVQQILKSQQIESNIKYDTPLSKLNVFAEFKSDKTPNTDLACNTVLSIPIHAFLTEKETDQIINTIWASA